MGKKQVVIVEYDVVSGDIDIRYYGISFRHEANKILIKLRQNLMKSLMGGFNPTELNDEEEVKEDGKRSESGDELGPEESRPDTEESGDGLLEDDGEAGLDRESPDSGTES